jgi:hypothetical protein
VRQPPQAKHPRLEALLSAPPAPTESSDDTDETDDTNDEDESPDDISAREDDCNDRDYKRPKLKRHFVIKPNRINFVFTLPPNGPVAIKCQSQNYPKNTPNLI